MSRRWEPEEENQLRTLQGEELPLHEIVRRLDRSVTAIKRRIDDGVVRGMYEGCDLDKLPHAGYCREIIGKQKCCGKPVMKSKIKGMVQYCEDHARKNFQLRTFNRHKHGAAYNDYVSPKVLALLEKRERFLRGNDG